MKTREALDAKLREILSDHDIDTQDGHLYYQQPSSHAILYPAIIYRFIRQFPIHADNIAYACWDVYELNVVTKEPYPDLVKDVCSEFGAYLQNLYPSNGLYHHIITVNW